MGKKVLNVATFGLAGLVPGKAGKILRSAILIGAGIASGNPQLIVAGVAMGASALKSTKGPKTSPSALDRLSASIDPRTPRKGVFGDTAFNTDVRDQEFTGTDNEFLHRFVVTASHRITSYREIHFDDKVAWTSTGGVQGEFVGYLTVEFILEGNADNAINISSRMGNTRRFTGCSYVHFRYKTTGNDKKTNSPFAQSIPSRLTIVGEGMPVYDPRYDSTAPGGSGPARANDQTTWQYSYYGSSSGRNPACQMITYLLGWRIRNPVTGEWRLALGKGQPVNRLDVPSFITAANLCEETVTLAAGGDVEPRYCSDGVFSEFDQATDVLDNLKAAMGAELDDMDGLIRVTVLHNDLAVPVLALTADDVLDDFTWNPRASLEETRNVVRGSYTDPSEKSLYQMVPYPDVTLASPDGIERAEPVNYQFVQSVSQAQRLSKQRLQRAQYAGTFTANFKSRLWRVQKNDIVSFTFGPAGFVTKLFRVVDIETRVDGIVPVTLREEHPNIYLWDAEERPAVQAVPSTPYTNFDLPVTRFLATVAEGADVTGDNVAGDFAGRGALATLNAVTYGTSTASGFGALAGRSTARLGNEVYLSNGTTLATDAALVTAQGTANDFNGRGALATLNAVDMATTQVVGKTAANITETTTRKWAAESGADITGSHVANDFAGRGALATLNAVALDTQVTDGTTYKRYATTEQTKLGGIATGATVGARTGTNLYRSDGVTVLTQAEVRTAEGTANDFAGRGALATLNAVALDTQVTDGTTYKRYATTEQTKLGGIATGATVGARTGTNLYRSDGVTVLTQAEVRTAEGTANDFAGRGALATLNAVALDTQVTDGTTYKRYATTEQTKLGGIATGATVGARSGTNLYRTDGVTVMTQAEVRTAEGTANDFAGRGALATLNAVALDTQVTDGTTYKRYATTEQTKLGGIATGATVGAQAGSNLYRTDGLTVMTQAEVRTAEGTANDFAGRGALATLNAVALDTQVTDGTTYKRYATTEQTKLGGIAAGATVGARSGTNLYRTDGVTVMTQAEVRTAEGTANDFNGRGALATLNAVALDTQVTDGTTYKRYATTEQTKLGGIATGATVGAQAGSNLYRTDGLTVMTQAEVRTAEGTANDFAGRGALATLNAVTYGTSTASGFGALAGRSTARLGNEVYLSNGTTLATDAALVTAQGTANDFNGRGALATLNAVALDTQVTDGTTYKRYAATEQTKLGSVQSGATVGDNLIPNPIFASDTSSWTLGGGTARAVGGAGDPYNYLRFPNGGTAALPVMPIPPGRTMYLSFWKRCVGGAGFQASINYSLSTSAGATVFPTNNDFSGAAATWTFVTIPISSGNANAAYSSINIYQIAAVTDGVAGHYIDLTGFRLSSTQESADVTIENPRVASSEMGASKGDNLLSNADLADGVVGWSYEVVNFARVAGVAGDPAAFYFKNTSGGAVLGQGGPRKIINVPLNASKLYFNALVKTAAAGSTAGINMFFGDAAGNYVTGATIYKTTTTTGWEQATGVVSVPSNAATVWVYLNAPANGSIALPRVAVVEPGANVTETRVANDFAGRGALATLNAVTYGTSTASGFGALAGRSTARLGNEVYLSNGTTLATDAALVTAQGTANDFNGRGALATLNTVNLATQVTGKIPASTYLPNVLAMGPGYKFTGAISYTSASDGTATISVGAGSVLAGVTISYSAMSVGVSGGTAGTTINYFLYVNDPTNSGGSQTLNATTNGDIIFGNPNYVQIGAVPVAFPASGSGTGSGYKGGGTYTPGMPVP